MRATTSRARPARRASRGVRAHLGRALGYFFSGWAFPAWELADAGLAAWEKAIT